MAVPLLLNGAAGTDFAVPGQAPTDLAVAPNYERFDGLGVLDHPGGERLELGYPGNPRPGQQPTPLAEQTYTEGPLSGVVGVLGGQPLPTAPLITRGPGDYTHASGSPSIQFRRGVGQNNTGLAQTVTLSEITSNPPQPGDLTMILAGIG